MQASVKRLGGPVQITTANATIYTAPTGGSASGAMVTAIIACNARSDSNSATYNLSLVPAGATISGTHLFISQKLLSPGDAPDQFNLQLALNPGDSIVASASGSGVNLILNGVEFS